MTEVRLNLPIKIETSDDLDRLYEVVKKIFKEEGLEVSGYAWNGEAHRLTIGAKDPAIKKGE